MAVKSMADTVVDVTVIGGGIVGLATALQALNDGFSVALLTPPTWQPYAPPTVWQSEVAALSPASLAFLAQLGVTAALRPRAGCFYQMQVYAAPTGQAASKEKFALHFRQRRAAPLGAIVENQALAAALAEKVLPRVAHYPCEVRQVERDEAFLTLHWGALHPDAAHPDAAHQDAEADEKSHEKGKEKTGTLKTRLLLAADGLHSSWRQRFGIPVQKTDYQQTALTAVFALAKSHRQTAWQVFLPGGPLAMLPLADKVAVMVWSLPTAKAEEYLAAPEQLVAAVNGYWLAQFGEVALQSTLHATPLVALHADYYAQGRFALLGDAAHRVHPLAGQGLNVALRDVATLAQLWKASRDPGDYRFLRRFERWRHLENAWLLKSFTLINQVFCQAPAPLRYASALGMAGLNGLPDILPVKDWLQKIAEGQSFYSVPLATSASGAASSASLSTKNLSTLTTEQENLCF